MSDAPSEHPLEPIFHPRSIAIVGVPRDVRGPRIGDFLFALMEQGEADALRAEVDRLQTRVRQLVAADAARWRRQDKDPQ